MADHATNEYTSSTRAQNDENDLFAAIGKQVMGLQIDDEDTDIAEDDRVKVVDEIESLCMNCEENGMTRLLLTKIPFFREVILMSFFCDHCSFRNNEIQPAGQIQELGSKYIFKVTHEDDLQRQLVKSDTATLNIRELELEIPAKNGRLTTIEGVLTEVLVGLEAGQKDRKKVDPANYEKISAVVQSLIRMSNGGNLPFTISIDDPAGNSSIEPSLHDSAVKGKYVNERYSRSPEQNIALGLGGDQESVAGKEELVPQVGPDTGEGLEDVDILEGQVYDLPIQCPGCNMDAHMLLQMVNIPHFKQVVISTTRCEFCNYRSSDVKTGGDVPEKGQRIFLDVKGPEDLSRDILKSESCILKVPECQLVVEPGTMGGRFTTVEGLITQVRDDLKRDIYDTDAEKYALDSMPEEKKTTWENFFSQLDNAIEGKVQFTIQMEDPLAASYCKEFGDPGKDPNVRIEEYERTEEENDALGLSDMRTHLNEEGEYVGEPVGIKAKESEGELQSRRQDHQKHEDQEEEEEEEL
ncbi:uncharacterized protein KY384_007835 [Bacidia gigantensis]|uniref:uncharacterized protein n=1 Tax=Bacidia gigantensis TaxID=2732470 RepID=UPI001D04CC3F|nr:uncharacterized protein KY384_007835 [Bacidia gigantensis]KAG8527681.1 hypothetical protein KY384_007835 [Bacidia gigantensis]